MYEPGGKPARVLAWLALELVQGVVRADQEEHVVFLEHDVGEVTDLGGRFLRVADGDDLHAVLVGDVQVLQGLADEVLGAYDLDDAEAFHERQEVEHVWAVQAFGECNGRVAFRVENVGDAELLEDARVGGAARLRDDVLDAEFLQVQHGEEARFQVFADTDDDGVRLGKRDARELLLAGGVGDHGLRDGAGDVLHLFGVVVHHEHVVAETGHGLQQPR